MAAGSQPARRAEWWWWAVRSAAMALGVPSPPPCRWRFRCQQQQQQQQQRTPACSERTMLGQQQQQPPPSLHPSRALQLQSAALPPCFPCTPPCTSPSLQRPRAKAPTWLSLRRCSWCWAPWALVPCAPCACGTATGPMQCVWRAVAGRKGMQQQGQGQGQGSSLGRACFQGTQGRVRRWWRCAVGGLR